MRTTREEELRTNKMYDKELKTLYYDSDDNRNLVIERRERKRELNEIKKEEDEIQKEWISSVQEITALRKKLGSHTKPANPG